MQQMLLCRRKFFLPSAFRRKKLCSIVFESPEEAKNDEQIWNDEFYKNRRNLSSKLLSEKIKENIS